MTRRLAVNAAVLAGLKIGAPALSLLIVLAISRRLGAEGLGRYSLAYSFLTLFGLIGSLGLPALLTREAARDRNRFGPLLSTAIMLGGGLSAALAILLVVLARLIGYDAETMAVLAISGLTLVPTIVQAFLEATFIGLERTVPIAAGSLVEHAFKVGLGIAALDAGWGLPAVLLCAALGKAAACAICLPWLGRSSITMAWADRVHFSHLVRQAPVFSLSAICATLYWRADVFLLSWLRGVTDVGYYTAAYRILDLAILAPQSLCHALYPRMAAGSLDAAAAQRWLMLLTAPAALAVTLASGPLVNLLYGPRLAPAAPLLAILIWTAIPYAWNRYNAYLLVAADRQRVDLAINAALLVVNVTLNLILIPRFGPAAAAAITLLTALVYAAAQFRCLAPVRESIHET